MDRLVVLFCRSLPPWLAGSWVVWLALVAGVLASVAIALVAAADLGVVSDPDALLSPIRWVSQPGDLA